MKFVLDTKQTGIQVDHKSQISIDKSKNSAIFTKMKAFII